MTQEKKMPTKAQLSPPDGVKAACKTGIQMVEDGMGGSGLEAATVREARAIVRGTPITIAKARKMVRWWGRNARFLDFDKDSPAWVAALLWGGRAGLSWSRRLKRTFDAKSTSSHSITTSYEAKGMPDIDGAVIVDSQADFDNISANEIPVEIHYKVNTPFFYDEKASEVGKDVKIRGPVYVGNDDYLDRHDELVTVDAIMNAWKGYSNNPVILYNHSKTYGVIGRMVSLSKGSFNGMQVPIGTAVIDSGEKDITRKIRKGMLKAFSIGFIAKAGIKECKDDDTCYMKFTEIDWVETSIVDVPASPDALFSVQKSIVATGTSKSGGCGCGCSGEKKIEEKHVVRIEEDENFITIVYGKSDEWEGIDVDTTGAPMDEPEDTAYYTDEDDDTKTVKNPVAERLNSMTAEEMDIATSETEVEDTLPVVDETHIKEAPDMEDAGEEMPEAEEDMPEEDMPEEEAEEEAEEEGEKSIEMPSPREALVDIAKALSLIIEKLDAQDEVEEEVSEIDALRAEVESYKAAEEARIKEAEMEAEVQRRVAERLESAPKEAPAPARKSITPDSTPATPEKKENGLASWLASNLAQRGA